MVSLHPNPPNPLVLNPIKKYNCASRSVHGTRWPWSWIDVQRSCVDIANIDVGCDGEVDVSCDADVDVEEMLVVNDADELDDTEDTDPERDGDGDMSGILRS
jgi:hypothetical protein